MKTWPDSDYLLLVGYLQQLSLQSKVTKYHYRSILRGFQTFVSEHFPNQPTSQECLRVWLCDREKFWTFQTLIHRTLMVDRFLDWLVTIGSLSVNPLAVLRQTYGPQRTPEIVRALLSPDPAQALDSLRPPPRFASHLGPLMLDHLNRMRSLGYRYEREEDHLLRFDRHLQTRPDTVSQTFEVLVSEWADLAANPILRLQRLQVGRALAESLRRTDPTIGVIPLDPHMVREAKNQQRRPYIFSEEEIKRLLATARHQ